MSAGDTSNEIREKKKVLRKEVRSRIRAMSNEDMVAQSAQVWERLIALDEYKKAEKVGLFLSMPNGEIKTDFVLAHSLANGKTIYIPQVGENFEKCDMDLVRVFVDHGVESSSDKPFHYNWPKNKWSIPEPPSDMPREAAAPGDIDLLVVPGLAFDRTGARLGQGKGYYDRFISRMRQPQAGMSDSAKPLLVAVATEPQLVDNIPVSEHDFRMDMLILPNQTMTFSRP